MPAIQIMQLGVQPGVTSIHQLTDIYKSLCGLNVKAPRKYFLFFLLDSPVGSEVHCYIVSCEEVRLCSSKSSCLTRSLLLSTHFQYPKVAAVSIPAKAKKIHNRDHDTVNVPAPLVAKNCMPKIVYNGRLSKNLRSPGLANMERLTATNDDGRNNNVTTVITRIVADSLTAASFNASVFPLIL